MLINFYSLVYPCIIVAVEHIAIVTIMVQWLGYVPNNLKLYFLIIDSLSKLLIPVGRDMKL